MRLEEILLLNISINRHMKEHSEIDYTSIQSSELQSRSL